MQDLLTTIQQIDHQSQNADGVITLTRQLAELGGDVMKAVSFALLAHSGQRRKYVNLPYVSHCIAVANIVKQVSDDPDMIKAALLHDVVEDTDRTLADVEAEFGPRVRELVDGLTDVSDAYKGQPGHNRASRKKMDREHTAAAHPDCHTVKLADLIHNAFSIVEHDPGFARTWMKEKELLVPMLQHGDDQLRQVAQHILDQYRGN
jgi:(p)ppGpp synthase/HD superfamily hydrolase